MTLSTMLSFALNTSGQNSSRPSSSKRPQFAVEQLESRELLSASSLHFDFGTGSSPVTLGYENVSVMAYDSALGYGWETTAGLEAFNDPSGRNPLYQDGHSAKDNTFKVDLDNGRYVGVARLGDPYDRIDRVLIKAEDQVVARNVRAAPGQVSFAAFTVNVIAGELNLQFVDQGGANPQFSLVALDLFRIGPPPQLPTPDAGADKVTQEGSSVQFSGGIPDRLGLSYLWDFGDGTTGTGADVSHTYDDNGTYNATVTVLDRYGQRASDSVSVTVGNVAPTATLTDDNPIEEGGTVTLSFNDVLDPSKADVQAGFKYSYDFDGDGAFDVVDSSSSTIQHVFGDNGNFTVTGRITDKDGGFNDYTTVVDVFNVAPTISLAGSFSGEVNQAIPFSATVVDPGHVDRISLQYHWDFGDGNSSSEAAPTHVYGSAGNFAVTLSVTDKDGASSIAVAGVLVTQPAAPLRVNAGADRTANEGSALQFTPTVTGGGTDLAYAWDFGDGTTGTGANVSHTYDDNGAYTATLTVSDGSGQSASDSVRVTVRNVAPTATLTDDNPVDEGEAVTLSFNDVSDPSTADQQAGFKYSYDFDGDGTFDVVDSSSSTIQHVFGDNGTFEVKGRITDKDGGFNDYTTTVEVRNVAPTISLASSFSGEVDQAIQFSATVADPGSADQTSLQYLWDFGDGSNSSDVAPAHNYSSAGNFTLTLIVTDKDGASGTATASVSVTQPVAPLEVNAGADRSSNEGSTVQFAGTATGGMGTLSYAWDFGDGTTGTGANVSHTYDDNGAYVATLTVRDGNGQSAGDSVRVTVGNVAPTATLTNNSPIDEGGTVTLSFNNFSDPSTADEQAGFKHSYDFDGDGTFDVVDSSSSTIQHVFGDNGTFEVKGRITDKDGGFNDYTTTVEVRNVAPTITLASSFSGDVDQAIQFSATVADPGSADQTSLQYLWSFGDGSSSTAATPTHTYGSAGNFTLTLTVTDKDGASSAATASVSITQPVAPLEVNAGSDRSSNEGSTVQFAGTATGGVGTLSYAWDFGDGTTGTGANVSHAYDDNSAYTATLTVSDGSGQRASDSVRVTVGNVAPTATLTNNSPIDEGGTVTLSFNNVADPSNADVQAGFKYSYDFDGDGTFDVVDSSSSTIQHVFGDNGTFEVKGRITDKDGGFNDYTTTVAVRNVAPAITLASSFSGEVDQVIQFSATVADPGSADQTSLQYLWVFGDGSSSTAATPTHIYGSAGNFTLTLTVTDKDGASSTTTASVSITQPLEVDAGANRSANEGSTVQFAGTATGGEGTLSYAWDFGDGSTGTGSDLTHSYADNGTYTATLTVTDESSQSVSDSVTITVNNVAPSVNLSNSYTAETQQAIQFSATVQDPSSTDQSAGFEFNWDFGDGNSSTAISATHSYDSAGTYTVTLTVTDKDGGSTTVQATAEVTASQGADLPPGAVAYYRFDESSGTITADSVGNNDATVHGAGWMEGTVGHALSFDGVDDQVTAPVDLNQWLGDTATLTVWVNTSQTGTNIAWDAPGITGVEQAGGTNDIFWGWLDASGRIGIQAGDGASAKSLIAINDGQWHHVALTRDAGSGNVEVYVDGEFQSGVISETGVRTTPFSDIGRMLGAARFQGSLDELIVFDRVLTANEIAHLSNLEPDTTAPTISSVTPIESASDVSTASNLTVTFSEAMDAGSLNASTIELRDNLGNLLATTVNYDASTRSAVVDPVANLASSTTFTALVKGGEQGVMDTSGNALASDYSWSFTTADAAAPPVITLGPDRTANEGSAVQFTSTVTGGEPDLTYAWDFGDGATATGELPSHTYADNGTYVVSVQVTDALGRSGTDSLTITVSNVAPTVQLNSSYTAEATQQILFRPNVQDPSTADQSAGFQYLWDFGDGQFSTLSEPSHSYAGDGEFVVTLTVTDKDGASDTTTASVIIAEQPDRNTDPYIDTPYDSIPNFGANPTIYAIASGDWSDATIWVGNRLPTFDDVVSIDSGYVVTYDVVSDAVLDSVVVQAGGHLIFRTDVDTKMIVENLLVLEGGELQVGTVTNPVQADVTAQIVFADTPYDHNVDPDEWGHGLIGLGTVTMHGAVKEQTFVRLVSEPKAGDTTITLAAPVSDWQVGDALAFPDTRQLEAHERFGNFSPEWEIAKIQTISADGRTLTLDRQLQFDHLGARDGDGVLEFLPHVANLKRNVVLKSQNIFGDHRGHVVFTHRADVDVRYTWFAGLGRTTDDPSDATDRYPVYFRHLIGPAIIPMNGYQYTFVGNTVSCPLDPMPFRWGITVENSHYGLISSNVLYNWAGAGLMTVAGNESYNVIENNYVLAIRGDQSPRGNDGLAAAGYWFAGYNNYVRDNVAASAAGMSQEIISGVGYKYFVPAASSQDSRIPMFKGADVSVQGEYRLVNMQLTPILEFARNEAYGASASGLTIWHLGTDGYSVGDIEESVIKDFHTWNVWEAGFYAYPIQNVTFDGFVVRGDPRLAESEHSGGAGWASGDYWAGNVTIRNADVQGMKWGIAIGTNTPGLFRIEDSYFRNYASNVSVETLATPGTGAAKPPRRTEIDNVRFDPWAGAANFTTIAMVYNPTRDRTDLIQTDEVFVYNYNGVQGDDFQLYYAQQAADFIVPQSTSSLVGSPEAGLTNAENWDKYGIAIAGAVAPDDTTIRDEIDGLIREL